MEKKDNGILGLIFLAAGIAFTQIHSLIAIICTLIAFIISLSDIKYKNGITILTLVGSIIVLGYMIVTMAFAYITVKDTLDDIDTKVYEMYEQRLKASAETRGLSEEILGNVDFSQNPTLVLTISDLEMEISNCTGYAIYDSKTDKAEAFISCDEYQTEGFENSYLK